ncbi:MAG: precorrin-2 dehydrogenase/sirohydrochlorin ferrochelatase family protein [Candidatus Nitrosocosmicus sp.]
MIVDLDINNKNILIIGAGIEGTKKVKLIVKYNCSITIISEKFSQEIINLKKKYNVKLINNKIEDTSILNLFNNIFLIFATTNDRSLNNKIIEWAKKNKILVYATDNPTMSDFAFLSIIDIENLIQIGISTSGKSPLMNKILKTKIEKNIKNIIEKNDINNIKIQEFARLYAKKYIEKPSDRKDFLHSLINNTEIQELIEKNNIDKVKERIINILEKLEVNRGR